MFSPELIIAGILLAALIIYALTGGPDFGGGMWDLLASGPRARKQRLAISNAIAPIWEANHVWLILVIVLLFTAFPPAFALIMTTLNVPMTLVLVGIVLRGSAFVFRRYAGSSETSFQRWSTVFGIASFLTPFFLGINLGALPTGDLVMVAGVPVNGYFAGWITPFALSCGVFAQLLFAFLAAVYLSVDTREHPDLQLDFRNRALVTGLLLAPVALLVFWLSRENAPIIFEDLTSWWGPWLLLGTSLCALTALWGLWRYRFGLARIAAIGQVGFILFGWGLAQYPYLVVPEMTFESVAAPFTTLRLVLIVLAGGALIILPSFLYLFRVFKGSGDPVELA